jgi:hypothetical protein
MVFDAHGHALAYFGAVPLRGIYDNLKAAVDAVFVGKERKFNRRFLATCPSSRPRKWSRTCTWRASTSAWR